MKRILCFLAFCTAMSCAKPGPGMISGLENGNEQVTEEWVTLQVGLPLVQTRLAGAAPEDGQVKDLQVFVFDVKSACLDAYAHESMTPEKVTVRCKKGAKHIYALVNAPGYETVEREEVLQKLTSELTENETGKLVMAGVDESVVLTGDGSVEIPVKRLVSQVILTGFSNQITIPQYKSKPLVVQEVYLLNAFGIAGCFEETAAQKYYNFKAVDQTPLALLYDKVTEGSVAAGASLAGQYHFYTYPNPATVDCTDRSETARFTRLVVKATFDGKVCYYPVSLPVLKPNTRYEVHMNVKRPGSDSPDIPVSLSDAAISIKVSPWEQGGTITETI